MGAALILWIPPAHGCRVTAGLAPAALVFRDVVEGPACRLRLLQARRPHVGRGRFAPGRLAVASARSRKRGVAGSLTGEVVQLRVDAVLRYSNDSADSPLNKLVLTRNQGCRKAPELEWNSPHVQQGGGTGLPRHRRQVYGPRRCRVLFPRSEGSTLEVAPEQAAQRHSSSYLM